ncbi:MAG: cysteine desulfurase [Bacteroidales bacterium]|nr:cysteine desulfurase [Bacteroidales bacterium]
MDISLLRSIRAQFPILSSQIHGRELVYLDNAATTQKPLTVIESIDSYYRGCNANIHRGTYLLAAKATEMYENVRKQVQGFIGARKSEEVVFTRGTTESINLVAASFAKRFFSGNDEVICTGMEHHSNIVPWQLAGATMRVIPFNDSGVLDLDAYQDLFNKNTRIVAICHVSNTLGTVNPIAEMIAIAHQHGVPVLIDGAQAVAHTKVDVSALDCDFYCFSGHKMYGPMGVGVMYGREQLLNQIPPYQGGGEMIENVTFEHTTYNALPYKFEAGTPSVGDVVGLGKAVEFIQSIGIDTIAKHENHLLETATRGLNAIPDAKIFGTADGKAAVLSFLIGSAHPYDVGTLLDQLGIAVRTGHHCTQPVMDRYGIPGTVRASFAVYNTEEDVAAFLSALERVLPMLG